MSNYRATYFNKNKSNYGWYKCQHCGKSFRKSEVDIDHIIPKSKGGSDKEFNLQILCIHCNRSKKDSTYNIRSDLYKSTKRILKRKTQKYSLLRFILKNH